MYNNILFTCVGKKAHLIKQFIASIQLNSYDIKCYATDSSKYAAGLYFADDFFISPNSDSDLYKDFIFNKCKKNAIGLIIPVTDYDLEFFANNKKYFNDFGISVMVPSKNNIMKYRDKILTAKIFSENSISYPKTYTIDDLSLCSKIISRPIDGSGSQGISIFEKRDFNKDIFNNDRLIIQEFIDGYEVTCDALVSDSILLAASQRRRLKVREGEVMNAKMIAHKGIYNNLEKMPLAFNMEDGLYTIQCIIKNNKPYFIEINPRFGGGAPMTIAAGLDLPSALIKKFIFKKDMDISTEINLIEMIRWDDAVFI